MLILGYGLLQEQMAAKSSGMLTASTADGKDSDQFMPWESGMSSSDIVIDKTPEGEDWILGAGAYGRVSFCFLLLKSALKYSSPLHNLSSYSPKGCRACMSIMSIDLMGYAYGPRHLVRDFINILEVYIVEQVLASSGAFWEVE